MSLLVLLVIKVSIPTRVWSVSTFPHINTWTSDNPQTLSVTDDKLVLFEFSFQFQRLKRHNLSIQINCKCLPFVHILDFHLDRFVSHQGRLAAGLDQYTSTMCFWTHLQFENLSTVGNIDQSMLSYVQYNHNHSSICRYSHRIYLCLFAPP